MILWRIYTIVLINDISLTHRFCLLQNINVYRLSSCHANMEVCGLPFKNSTFRYIFTIYLSESRSNSLSSIPIIRRI